MLATVPTPLEPMAERARGTAAVLHALPEACCPVCSGSEVVTDEVMRLGALHLSECLHCGFRWTERRAGRWAHWGPRIGAKASASPPAG